MERWLRVDCDYAAEGLWTPSGAAISVVNVPISGPLRDRLIAWQRWFDEAAAPWENGNAYDWDLHERIAIDIARCIKRELPDWTVVALRREINPDGSIGRLVPYPGEHLLGGRAPKRR